jgi:hypothetical protein
MMDIGHELLLRTFSEFESLCLVLKQVNLLEYVVGQ